jgi:hypothetical protein
MPPPRPRHQRCRDAGRLFKLAAEYEARAGAQDGADEAAPAVRYGKRHDDDD